MNRAYKLLGILQSYAPNSTAQALTTTIYNKMQADGTHGLELEKAMVSALHDGLQYGNWCWNMMPIDTTAHNELDYDEPSDYMIG